MLYLETFSTTGSQNLLPDSSREALHDLLEGVRGVTDQDKVMDEAREANKFDRRKESAFTRKHCKDAKITSMGSAVSTAMWAERLKAKPARWTEADFPSLKDVFEEYGRDVEMKFAPEIYEGQLNLPMLVTLTLKDGFAMLVSQDFQEDRASHQSEILKASKDGNIRWEDESLTITPWGEFTPATEEERRSHNVRRTFVVWKANNAGQEEEEEDAITARQQVSKKVGGPAVTAEIASMRQEMASMKAMLAQALRPQFEQ